MSRSWLVKKGKILQKKETACAKTQKCDLGEGGGGKSLQTNLAFPEPGCLKPERAVETRERRRDQAMTKFLIGILRGLDFILRTQGPSRDSQHGRDTIGLASQSFGIGVEGG